MSLTSSLDAATASVNALVAALALSNTRFVYATDTGVADAYVFSPTPAVTSYGPDLILIGDVQNPNATTTPHLTIGTLGSVPIQWDDGTTPTSGDVSGKVMFGFSSNGSGGWIAKILSATPVANLASRLNVRTKLTSNTTIYVNASTGSDSNTGTSGAPFLTIQAAVNWVYANLDLAGHVLTFSLSGSFSNGVQLNGSFVGQTSYSSVVFSMGTATITAPSATYPNNGSCFQVINWASCTLTGGGQLSAPYGFAVNISEGTVAIGTGVNFGACASGGAHMACTGPGLIYLLGNYTISAGAGAHFYLVAGSFLTVPTGLSPTITCTGAINFSSAFAYCSGATMAAYPLTFAGTYASVTGARYLVGTYGYISTNGGGANYFPGNSAGSGTGSYS